MHHFVTEMCTQVHNSITKLCIVGYRLIVGLLFIAIFQDTSLSLHSIFGEVVDDRVRCHQEIMQTYADEEPLLLWCTDTYIVAFSYESKTPEGYLAHNWSHSTAEYTCIHTTPLCCRMSHRWYMGNLCIRRHLTMIAKNISLSYTVELIFDKNSYLNVKSFTKTFQPLHESDRIFHLIKSNYLSCIKNTLRFGRYKYVSCPRLTH